MQTAQGEADRADAMPDLIVPVQGLAKSSLQDNFGDPREGGAHDAIDIPAPRGTPVLAAAEGNVVKLFTSERGGLTVYQFDDSRTWCYYYAHLDRYAPGLKEGALLRQGDVLGFVGTTGNAPPDTPHLHFSVFRLGPEKAWWKGEAVDPLPLIRQGG
jgi:murein DD-endopeptidase MepM/ murein hydrolase activator NlpD